MNNIIQKIIDLNKSNMLSLTSIVLITTSIFLMILRYNGSRKRLLANRIPGPDGSFLIGLLPIIMKSPEAILKEGVPLYQKYEKTLFKVWIFNNLYIILSQPEDIELILTNPKLQKKAKEYLVLQESIMGQGIFSIDDIKKWKNNRKMVSGGFNFTILKSFILIFNEEANVLNEIIQKKSANSKTKECEIHNLVSMTTMEMIGRTAFGVKFNAQKGGRHKFIENLQTAMQTWEYRIAHPWFLSKTLFRLSLIYYKHQRSQKIIHSFTDDIINKKLNELNQNKSGKEFEIDDDINCKKHKTLIEILLENKHGMSHEQIRDELVTIMIGGQETTAMANASAFFMLAHHQDIQSKVFEEIQTIFSIGDPNRQPTYEDLLQMEYLERVIKETLRHFPPLAMFGRSLDEEMEIGGYLCPAGSTLIVAPYFLQMSPLFYTDPKKFDPDNFLPERSHSRHPYTFLPFSAGYRNCIGIKYAMLQMKTVISTIVRKNKLLPSDKCPTPDHLRLMFLSTLKFVNGCYIKIEPRTS